MAFLLKDTQQVGVKLTAFDKDGYPTTDLGGGSIIWSSSAPDFATVAVDPNDQFQATIVSVKPGPTQVSAVCHQTDGDDITALVDIEVIAGEAASFGVEIGEPTEKPQP